MMILKEIGNEILPIIVATIVTILGVIVSTVGKDFVGYIQAKHTEAVAKAGIATYNKNRQFALDVWNLVDEHFRISGTIKATIQEKVDLFNKELLKRIPNLTQSQLDFLRQSIAGEINKGRDAILQPATGEIISTSTDVAKEPDKVIETAKTDSNVITPIEDKVATESVQASTVEPNLTSEVKNDNDVNNASATPTVELGVVPDTAKVDTITQPIKLNTTDTVETINKIQDLLSTLKTPQA